MLTETKQQTKPLWLTKETTIVTHNVEKIAASLRGREEVQLHNCWVLQIFSSVGGADLVEVHHGAAGNHAVCIVSSAKPAHSRRATGSEACTCAP